MQVETAVDIACAVYLLGAFLTGFLRGGYRQLGILIATVVALLGAYIFREEAAVLLEKMFHVNYVYAALFGFPAGYIVLYLVLLVFMGIVYRLYKPATITLTMRVSGAALGFCQGLIVTGVALMLVGLLPGVEGRRSYAISGLENTGLPEQLLTGSRIEKISRLAELSRDPARMDILAANPEVRKIIDYAPVRDVLGDSGIRELVASGNLPRLIEHPKVEGILRDPVFRDLLLDVDLDAILGDTRLAIVGVPEVREERSASPNH